MAFEPLAPHPAQRSETGRPVPEWEKIADSYDWTGIRCSCAGGARHVPADFARLLAAQTAEEATGNGLLGDVATHGLLSEAAVPVARMALAAFRDEELSVPALRTLTMLIINFTDGEADQEAIANGREDVGDECREVLLEGIPLFYAGLAESVDKFVPQYLAQALRDLGEDPEKVRAAFDAGPR
ncbi:hypothetical protein [Kitasatospora griseola]|uniref:hypothetical protein n=1 Tax=Kitasatospora griseola TaxID=2064 RepID=UPI00344022F8